MKGFITRKRYTVTTVFVDHFSGLSFTHLQKSNTAAEVDRGKARIRAIRQDARCARQALSRGHWNIRRGGIRESGQLLCRKAHHQNGRAEKKIRNLQDLSRTMILHAKQRWPTAVSANLWHYAMRMAKVARNQEHSVTDRKVLPSRREASNETQPHVWGPSVCARRSVTAAEKAIPKWSEKVRIGMYLGSSPRHSRKVALVLSLQTGHVSPQFHVVIDDLFETLRPSVGNSVHSRSRWQEATGFAGRRKQGRTGNRASQQPRSEADIVGVIPLSELGALPVEPLEDVRTTTVSDHGDDERSTEAEEFHPISTTRVG
jgi:hypothetical protein